MNKNPLIQIDRALLNPDHIIWVRHQADGELWVKMSGADQHTVHKGEVAEDFWRYLTVDCHVVVPETPAE